jgi:hypothetical protein
MASTFTTSLKFNKPALGDAGWGTAVNGGFTDLVDQALGGQASIDVGSGPGPFVLTIPDGASGDARNMFIRATGNPGGAREIQVPTNRKLYFVTNDSDGAVTVKVSGQTGVVVPVGASMALRINAAGTDVAPALTYQASMTLGTALAATSGGTGQSSYAVGDLLYAGTTTTLTKLAAAAVGNVLRAKGTGTAPAWEQVVLTTDVTGVLPAANGGTGLSSPGALGNVPRSDGAGAWTSSALASATDTAEGLVELATTAEVQTGTDTTRAITPAGLRGGMIAYTAAQILSSGTEKDFSVPSWAKRITILLTNVSTNGTSNLRVRILDTTGSPVVTTGYAGSAVGLSASVGFSSVQFSAGFDMPDNSSAANVRVAMLTLAKLDDGGDTWVLSGTFGSSDTTRSGVMTGWNTLSAPLAGVRITTVNGTDAFDSLLSKAIVCYE